LLLDKCAHLFQTEVLQNKIQEKYAFFD